MKEKGGNRSRTLLLGAHMSIAGGTPLAVERARSVGATAMQIFVKNNNRWVGKELTELRVGGVSGGVGGLQSARRRGPQLLSDQLGFARTDS